MCYSKEVQLVTSLIILFSSLMYYLYFSQRYKTSKKEWLIPFLNVSTLVFLSIGLHQFFEFLSLVTNNQIIYKIGLIISISAVYFLLRSLEVLSNTKLQSWIALLIIAAIAIEIFLTPMNFEAASFYLRHNSAFFWAAAWLFLFIYWHICALRVYSHIQNDRSRKTLIIYLLTIADASFFLSALYVLSGHFLFSVNVCTDSPSIWCTFYVIQSLLIPFLFFRLPTFHRAKEETISWKKIITYLIISLMLVIVLVLTLPLFQCLTWKSVFP